MTSNEVIPLFSCPICVNTFDLDDNEIEIAVSDTGGNSTSFEIPGMPGANVGMINIGEMLGKSMGAKEKKKKMIQIIGFIL